MQLDLLTGLSFVIVQHCSLYGPCAVPLVLHLMIEVGRAKGPDNEAIEVQRGTDHRDPLGAECQSGSTTVLAVLEIAGVAVAQMALDAARATAAATGWMLGTL